MDRDIEHGIAETARRQHGVVTRTQLLGLGLGAGAVRARAGNGRLRRLHRGVYFVGAVLPPLAREMAAVMACGRGALVSHRSAASLLGIGRTPAESDPVEVRVPGGHKLDREGILIRSVGEVEPAERRTFHGIPVTSPGLTLLDLAAIADRRELEQALARAGRERLIDDGDLVSLAVRSRGRPGGAALRAVLEAAAGPALTRSEAEDRLLALVRAAKLPAPEVNARFHGMEIDFLWRRERIAVEVDGYRYHGSRARFEADRRRATRLAARGIQVIPLTWRQIVDDGLATAVQLGQALARAALR